MIRFIVTILLLTMFASAGDITVEVSGVKEATGTVRGLLFSTEKGFPEDHTLAAAKAEVVAKKGAVRLIFKGMEAGKYAVVVVHDMNNNKVVEKNALGIPKEPIAVSNWSRYGKPKFAKSIVRLTPGATLKLTLK